MLKIVKEIGLQRVCRYFIFGLWQWLFELLPFSPLRIWWLRLGGAKIGWNCVVERVCFMNLDRTGLKGLVIGNDCYLGPLVLLDLADRIHLGNQVTISAKAAILTHNSVGFSNHPLLEYYPKISRPVHFGSGSVLSVNSVIFCGLTVGANSLIAANSVVTKNVPGGMMVAGAPAEVKKKFS